MVLVVNVGFISPEALRVCFASCSHRGRLCNYQRRNGILVAFRRSNLKSLFITEEEELDTRAITNLSSVLCAIIRELIYVLGFEVK